MTTSMHSSYLQVIAVTRHQLLTVCVGRSVLRCTDSIRRPIVPVAPARQQPTLRPNPRPDLRTTRSLRDRPSLHKLHSARHICISPVPGLHLGKVDELPVVPQSDLQSLLGTFRYSCQTVDSRIPAMEKGCSSTAGECASPPATD